MSSWTDYVMSVFHENKKKNSNFTFKDALQEASRRRKSGKQATKSANVAKKGKKSKTSKKNKKSSGTRRRK